MLMKLNLQFEYLMLFLFGKKNDHGIAGNQYISFITKLFFIVFLANSISVKAQIDSTTAEHQEVFIVVEKMPEFPGGIDSLLQFINKRAVLTDDAIAEKVSGRVFVSFFIKVDGSVSEPKVIRGLHPDLDSISLGIVKSMPKWIPGEQRGKPVKCRYNLPIRFDYYKAKIRDTEGFTRSKYWRTKGYKKFMKICEKDYNKSLSECECWLHFIIWNYNDKELGDLNLEEMFQLDKCL